MISTYSIKYPKYLWFKSKIYCQYPSCKATTIFTAWETKWLPKCVLCGLIYYPPSYQTESLNNFNSQLMMISCFYFRNILFV